MFEDLLQKTGKEVATAISAIVREMEAALGVKGVITRFHTDSGKEFYNETLRQTLSELNIYQSGTGGYDPKPNGLAERFVGIIKQRAEVNGRNFSVLELGGGTWC